MIPGESRRSLLRNARIIDPEAEARAAAEAAAEAAAASPSAGQLPAGRIVEVHAEASYRAMAGAPLEVARHALQGGLVRTRLLHANSMPVPTELGQVGHVPVDELLDAAAIAWTAHRYAHGQAFSLPAQEAWQQDGTQIVAIWV